MKIRPVRAKCVRSNRQSKVQTKWQSNGRFSQFCNRA